MAQQFGLRRVQPRSTDATTAAEALLVAAERDAGEIVGAARADVQRTILRAQQELLALNAQVRTTLERLDGRDGRREQGRPDGGPFAASRVLREAHAQLDALAIDARPAGVIVAHPATATLPPPAILSPYERDNPRVVAVPPPPARRRRVVPPLAIALAAVLVVVVGWVWTRGSLWPRRTEVRPVSDPVAEAANQADTASQPSAGATGMVGRTAKSARGVKPERTVAPGPRPLDTATESSALTKNLPPPQSTPPAERQELLSATERWLDAYYRRDSGAMVTLSMPAATLSDERAADERLPAGLRGVRRTLTDTTVQVFGSDAILTAKITERSDVSGQESASFISQMWTRRGGTWQVTDVRIVSAAAVARAFKR